MTCVELSREITAGISERLQGEERVISVRHVSRYSRCNSIHTGTLFLEHPGSSKILFEAPDILL